MTAEAHTREEMPKAYNPAAVERTLYERWEATGYFTPKAPPAPKRAPHRTRSSCRRRTSRVSCTSATR